MHQQNEEPEVPSPVVESEKQGEEKPQTEQGSENSFAQPGEPERTQQKSRTTETNQEEVKPAVAEDKAPSERAPSENSFASVDQD